MAFRSCDIVHHPGLFLLFLVSDPGDGRPSFRLGRSNFPLGSAPLGAAAFASFRGGGGEGGGGCRGGCGCTRARTRTRTHTRTHTRTRSRTRTRTRALNENVTMMIMLTQDIAKAIQAIMRKAIDAHARASLNGNASSTCRPSWPRKSAHPFQPCSAHLKRQNQSFVSAPNQKKRAGCKANVSASSPATTRRPRHRRNRCRPRFKKHHQKSQLRSPWICTDAWWSVFSRTRGGRSLALHQAFHSF